MIVPNFLFQFHNLSHQDKVENKNSVKLELKPIQKAHLQIHLLQCFPCLQSSITKYDNFLLERVKGA